MHAQQVLPPDAVNPKVFRREEWGALRKAGDAFVREVMSKPRLDVMRGEDEPG